MVAPASVIGQWETEVNKHVKSGTLSVKLHHGPDRHDPKNRPPWRFDIVITSYATLQSDHKSDQSLHTIKWNRIILDEAHTIRNNNTSQAVACFELKGTHRWLLTGTPVQNKLADLYSMLKFLKCTPYDEQKVFGEFIKRHSHGSSDRLAVLLGPLMLRRTKAEMETHRDFKKMPTKTVETIELAMNESELMMYSRVLAFSRTYFCDFLEQRERKQIAKGDWQQSSHITDRIKQAVCQQRTVAAGDKDHNIMDEVFEKFREMHDFGGELQAHHILVLILRMRQMCNHPGFILSVSHRTCSLLDTLYMYIFVFTDTRRERAERIR